MLLVLALPSALVPATMAIFLCVPQSGKEEERMAGGGSGLSAVGVTGQQKALNFLRAKGNKA